MQATLGTTTGRCSCRSAATCCCEPAIETGQLASELGLRVAKAVHASGGKATNLNPAIVALSKDACVCHDVIVTLKIDVTSIFRAVFGRYY